MTNKNKIYFNAVLQRLTFIHLQTAARARLILKWRFNYIQRSFLRWYLLFQNQK